MAHFSLCLEVNKLTTAERRQGLQRGRRRGQWKVLLLVHLQMTGFRKHTTRVCQDFSAILWGRLSVRRGRIALSSYRKWSPCSVYKRVFRRLAFCKELFCALRDLSVPPPCRHSFALDVELLHRPRRLAGVHRVLNCPDCQSGRDRSSRHAHAPAHEHPQYRCV